MTDPIDYIRFHADRPTWERSASGHLYLEPPRSDSPSRRILGWVAYHRHAGGWRWHATTTTGDRVGGRVPPGAGTALARGRALVEAAIDAARGQA